MTSIEIKFGIENINSSFSSWLTNISCSSLKAFSYRLFTKWIYADEQETNSIYSLIPNANELYK